MKTTDMLCWIIVGLILVFVAGLHEHFDSKCEAKGGVRMRSALSSWECYDKTSLKVIE